MIFAFLRFFRESSEEEREHAEKLMKYQVSKLRLCLLFGFWNVLVVVMVSIVFQNMRGGRVKLFSILMPPSEFEHVEKGDALYGKASFLFAK